MQPNPGDPISDAQYRTAAWWLRQMIQQYGPLQLVQHKDTKQGKRTKKSDVGLPFDMGRLLELL